MKRTTLIANKSGLKTEFHTEDGKGVTTTTQDVSNTIGYVKQLRDNTPGKDLRHVAEVPLVIWEKAVQEGWHKDKAKWRQWLNNPDNAIFRTWPGKV
jgi:hypothetical protein|tara:strand:- start:2406 stop:2696 length:291 start_codon:yes stop_codon:yes gene_type:complete